MLLLEYKQGISIKVSNNENIIREEFNMLLKKQEYMRIMGISIFKEPKKMWMSANCKFYMKNTKEQGYAHIDWQGLALAKHRR